MIAKVVFGAAIALGAAVGAPPPAHADPNLFGNLSCGCGPGTGGGAAAVTDQVDLGYQNGLAYLRALPASGNRAPSRAATSDPSSR